MPRLDLLCGMALARFVVSFVVRRCWIARLLTGSSLARFVVRLVWVARLLTGSSLARFVVRRP